MKEEILRLRSIGMSYNEIVKKLKCSKSLVNYYCAEGAKEKVANRQSRNRSENRLLRKISAFKQRSRIVSSRLRDFKYSANEKPKSFSVNDVLKKIGGDPKCYLTGKKIDLLKTTEYHFDHIVPVSRGGSGDLDNLGLLTKTANMMKHNLTIDELIETCINILRNHGYYVRSPRTAL